MTLPASGAISLSQIAAEFSLASSAVFPTAFYGKGGAPSSGALSLFDFYGRSAAPGFSATASPSPITRDSNTSTITTTTTCTATPTGGTGPYTYSWMQDSGDAITAVSATSATTSFRAIGMTIGESRTATFFCQVTDSLSNVTTTNIITASISRSS